MIETDSIFHFSFVNSIFVDKSDLMKTFGKYLSKYEIVVNTISLFIVFLEFFVYRGIRFAAAHATIFLFVSVAITLIFFFLNKKRTKQIFHTLYSIMLAISVTTLGICIYDRYIKSHNSKDTETVLLTEASVRLYKLFLEETSDSPNKVNTDITTCIFYRKDKKDIHSFIKFNNHYIPSREINYFSTNYRRDNLYSLDKKIINKNILKDKDNHFLPKSTHDVILGVREFNKLSPGFGIEFFKKASEDGNALADLYLYEIYKYGHGCTADTKLANKYLNKASNGGSLTAKYILACQYLDKDSPSHWDLDIADGILKEILLFKPNNELYIEDYNKIYSQAFIKIMSLYDVIYKPREAYRISRRAYKSISKKYVVPEYILIKHVINCINLNKEQKALKYLEEGRRLEYASAYRISATLLSSTNVNHQNDKEIEQYLIHSARNLEDQNSREDLIQFYISRKDTVRAEIWQKLYDIEYSNRLD